MKYVSIARIEVDHTKIDKYKEILKEEIESSLSIEKEVKVLYPVSVLYLLHGYGGNHKEWLEIKPELPEIASYFHRPVQIRRTRSENNR